MNECGSQSRVEVESGPGLVSHILGQLVFLEPFGDRADPTLDLWTEVLSGDGEKNYDQQVRLPVLFLLIVNVFHGRAEELGPDANITQGRVHSSTGGPLSGGTQGTVKENEHDGELCLPMGPFAVGWHSVLWLYSVSACRSPYQA